MHWFALWRCRILPGIEWYRDQANAGDREAGSPWHWRRIRCGNDCTAPVHFQPSYDYFLIHSSSFLSLFCQQQQQQQQHLSQNFVAIIILSKDFFFKLLVLQLFFSIHVFSLSIFHYCCCYECQQCFTAFSRVISIVLLLLLFCFCFLSDKYVTVIPFVQVNLIYRSLTTLTFTIHVRLVGLIVAQVRSHVTGGNNCGTGKITCDGWE